MKVLRSYEWDGHRYVVVERADGSRVEIKGDLAMTDAKAVAKTPKIEQPIGQQIKGPIFAFSDDEISDMDRNALEFWRQWKAPLMAMCAAHAVVVKDEDTQS